MAEENIKTQVLLELSLQQLFEGSCDKIIHHTLSLYMRKLNCFMTAVMTNEGDEFVIPHTLKNAELWQHLKQFPRGKSNNYAQLIEFEINTQHIYAYTLPHYGWLFLGKNLAFSVEIKNELVKLVSQFARSLRQLQEENRLKLLQSLINNSSDAIQVAKESGQLYYVNHLSAERLGITQHEAHNYYVQDFEESLQDEALWQAHLEELKRVKFMTSEGINVHQKTGASFPVEVTLKYVNIGNQGFVIANSRDVSSRVMAQRQLRRQEEKYRNIIANMHIGLVEINVDLNVVFANQSFCDMSGYDFTELKGRNYNELFPGLLHAPKTGADSHDDNKQKDKSHELEILTKSGEKRWWFVSSTPNFNDKGIMTGFIAVHVDITDQKLLEKDLASAKNMAEQASSAKEIFLANMSHEIRTPLNVIIGMVRQLNKEKLSGQQLFYVNQAATSANHLLATLNNILDMAKIESGEVLLENKHFSINSLADNIHSILSSQSKEKGLDFKLKVADNIKEALVGDDVRIRQVLINLLDNAIKFTEKGFVSLSVSVIETSDTRQLLQFDITDSGIGMSESFIADIFQLFSQEDATASRKFGGTGLGFTIANDLLKLMGSELQLESSKGEGTHISFKLSLPVGDKSALTGKSETVKPMALEGFHVLLVEDNDMNRFIAQHSLTYLGCSVMEAENGKEAVEIAGNNEFDLILMDIQMPEMSGLEATQYIRHELKKDTPIIALTANAFKHDIEKYMEEGMNDYIIKPYDEQDLFRKLNHFYKMNQKNSTGNEHPLSADDYGGLYDLGVIREMSRGNEAFVQKMLHIFVTVVEENVNTLKMALQDKDIGTINKTAHKLKPSIDQMGIISLKEKIRILEKFPTEKSSENELDNLVEYISDILENISRYIQAHELKNK